MTTDRIAPSIGYDNPIKMAYRQELYTAFAPSVIKALALSPRARYVIMPSSEGIEIDVAIAHGIPAEKIFCVDRSAAIIATSAWRKKHPHIEFAACEVADAPQKAFERERIVIGGNLDLCGNFSEETVKTVTTFANNTPGYTTCLAVTIAKGREGSALHYLIRHRPESAFIKDSRMAALLISSGLRFFEYDLKGQGSYVSHRTPMTWACFAEKFPTNDLGRLSHVRRMPGETTEELFKRCFSSMRNFDMEGLLGAVGTAAKEGYFDKHMVLERNNFKHEMIASALGLPLVDLDGTTCLMDSFDPVPRHTIMEFKRRFMPKIWIPDLDSRMGSRAATAGMEVLNALRGDITLRKEIDKNNKDVYISWPRRM